MAIIRLVVVNAEGPQGAKGDQGPSGSQGPPGSVSSAFPFSGSAVITGSLLISGSNLTVLGSVTSTSFTGSLLGTSSFSINAITASYVLNAVSSSYTTYAENGGVTQLLAGPNITLSPTNGLGQVTISSTGGGGSSFNTATGSYGSFYDTTTQTNPVGNVPRSMSLNTTAITNGVSISGSTNPFNTYIKTENAGVYNIQFSAQLDKTDSGTDEIVIWLRKNGIDLIDTATTISLVGNNAKNVAAWNWFVNSAANDYYQIIWYSPDTAIRLLAEVAGGGHPGIPSVIVTANRVDQFLSNTGSFSGSFTGQFTGSLFGTASQATNAISASHALTASYALNSSTVDTNALVTTSSFNTFTSSIQTQVNSLTAATSSYITTSQTSSMTVLSASFAATASLAPNYVLTSVTASMRVASSSFATTASFIQIAQTASYVLNAVSSSFAATASLAPNYLLTASTASMLAPYVLSSQTSSFVQNSQTSSMLQPYVLTSQTSSMAVAYATNAITSSYIDPLFISASAASYGFGSGGGATTPTGSLLTTASFTSPNITFTKGDSTTFTVNIAPLTSSLVQSSQTSSFTQLATGLVTASVSATQFTVVSGSTTEFTVTGTGVTIGSATTDVHQVTGSLNITGSLSFAAVSTASLRNSGVPYVVYTDVTDETTTSTTSTNLLTTFGFTIPDAEWPLGGMLKITGYIERTAGAGSSFCSVSVNSSQLRYASVPGQSMVYEWNIIKISPATVRIAYGPSNTGNASYNVHNAASLTPSSSAGNYAVSFGLYTATGNTAVQRWMKAIMIP